MKIVALMGKAGSGKDTILQDLLSMFPSEYHEIVSCTTRPPREGEQNGINYHFLTKEQFIEKVNNHDMLEYTEFNNWLYGTSLASLSKDKINIGVFNPEGVRHIMQNPSIDLLVFYVITNNKTRLLRQLNREEFPDVEEIIRRYQADEIDFRNLSDINYTSIRNELDGENTDAALKIWSYLNN